MSRSTLLLVTLLSLVAATSRAEWEQVTVPGGQNLSGYAYYRTWFKAHDSYFSKHERDLFGESVILNVRGLAGAHAVYVNGTLIGSGGQFPPGFKDGRDGNHRHKIPSGTLIKDYWNELVVKVYNPSGTGGFLTEAPFLMNYFWECIFAGKWELRKGGDESFLGVAVKKKPSHTYFDSFHESNRVLGEAEKLIHGQKLSPENSLAKMNAAEDLVVDLVLAEPRVAQPTHFSFDSRGRLWVSQYRQYPYPAGVEMVSRDRYYRSHYDKIPPAPPHHDRGRDVISIHEDTDGDGKYDRHKVFQDGLNMANAAVRGRDGVWVMNTPYLLFYPDKNFDDAPDGPPTVHLQGFGMEDTHSVANGLVWGMDGWLYGAQGSTTSCHVTRPGIDPPDSPGVYFQGCMVWRYHPESRCFEIFAQGGGNNFGLEIDSCGRLFTGNNGGTTRGFHYVQGGMHLMQGTSPNKFGPPRNPFAFGVLPKMESEQPIPRFTHFATLVESSALPQKYQGTFFSVEPLHNFVIASERIAAGATFRTNDIGKVLTSDDFAFRPVYIANAPDGSVMLADFYEHYIAHGQHYQSQIDPTSGRIFRLRGKTEQLERRINLHDQTTDGLLTLLSHPNRWHRHTAARLLGERKATTSMPKLKALIRSDANHESLCALWALHQMKELDDDAARDALTNAYPPVRYWAVRLICDDVGFANRRTELGLIESLGEPPGKKSRLSHEMISGLLHQAAQEPNVEVRCQMAASARRLPVDQALALLEELLQHEEDLHDAYLPLMCWWVIELNLDRGRDDVLAMLQDTKLRSQPMVVQHLLRRVMRAFALKGKNKDLLACAKLLEMANSKEQLDQLLEGFERAYAGRGIVGLPNELARALVDSRRTSLSLRIRLGEQAAVRDGIKLLGDDQTETSQRVVLARALSEVRTTAAVSALLEVAANAKDTELQRVAMASVSAFDDPKIADFLIAGFANYAHSVRPAFFDLMLSRIGRTRQFIEAIAGGKIDVSEVTADVVDQLREHSDASIASHAIALFGAGKPFGPNQVRQRVAQLRAIVDEGTGNPYAGEKLFIQRCSACHTLFHKGGTVGPDLTPYQRGNLDTLLMSVVDPSAEIREGYEQTVLLTSDGRTLTGFVVDEDPQIVTLRSKSGENIRVGRVDVESRNVLPKSLMPDGVLQGLTDQQLRDFFAYLRISQPISH